MAGKITQQQAISNLENLAKLVCNGDNSGNVHLGLMKTTDGRTRVVKFNAGKTMTPEMTESWNELRAQINTWANASNDAKWIGFAKELVDGEQLNDSAVVVVKNVLDRTLPGKDFKAAEFENGRPLSFKEVKDALATDERFTYRKQDASERGAAIGRAVGLRSKFLNAVHAIGRGFMQMTHAIKAFFHGRVGTKEWKETVEDYKRLVGASGQLEEWTRPEPDELGRDVKLDAHVVASSCGLSGELAVRPFNKGEKLFPDGSPSIGDIQQNPDLQDCWFLSSVASVLRTQGPDYIKGLIDTKTAPAGSALVRLGKHRYQVPLGDVMVDGKCAVSDSKPWVRLLEQAMAMHLNEMQMTRHKGAPPAEGTTNMAFRSAHEAIDALLGKESATGQPAASGLSFVNSLHELEELFKGGSRPVVMGTHSGLFGKLASLGTGISSGHACTLLKVDERNNRFTVLDPYGHIRHVSGDDLKHFDTIHATDAPRKKNENAVDPAKVDNVIEPLEEDDGKSVAPEGNEYKDDEGDDF